MRRFLLDIVFIEILKYTYVLKVIVVIGQLVHDTSIIVFYAKAENTYSRATTSSVREYKGITYH